MLKDKLKYIWTEYFVKGNLGWVAIFVIVFLIGDHIEKSNHPNQILKCEYVEKK